MSKKGTIICVNSKYVEIESFCTFEVESLIISLIIKPKEVDTNNFSDWSSTNEIIKVKHVKPIQEKV